MRVLTPASFDEACAMRAEIPDAVPLAGGTDLLVDWPTRFEAHDRTYIDLSKLPALRRIEWREDELVIGAGVTLWDVRRDAAIERELPLLPRAAARMAALQIQTRATWVGNVVTGSALADGAAVLLAHEARIALAGGESGAESIPLRDFYGDADRILQSKRALVRAIRVPRRRYSVAIFEKVGLRAANTRSDLNLTALESEGRWRIVVGGLTPRAIRCGNLESRIESRRSVDSPDDLLAAVRRDAGSGSEPDRSDASRETYAYRERALARILTTALSETVPWIRGNLRSGRA